MTQDTVLQLAVALLTGGVGVKLIETLFGGGKRLRDELRKDISRLENRIKELDTKVDQLENEIEQWKGKAEDWRNKYFEQQRQYHRAILLLQRKDETIRRLRFAIRVLVGYLQQPIPEELRDIVTADLLEEKEEADNA